MAEKELELEGARGRNQVQEREGEAETSMQENMMMEQQLKDATEKQEAE